MPNNAKRYVSAEKGVSTKRTGNVKGDFLGERVTARVKGG